MEESQSRIQDLQLRGKHIQVADATRVSKDVEWYMYAYNSFNGFVFYYFKGNVSHKIPIKSSRSRNYCRIV